MTGPIFARSTRYRLHVLAILLTAGYSLNDALPLTDTTSVEDAAYLAWLAGLKVAVA